MPTKSASVEAIDDLLAQVGLQHGRRRLLGAGYVPQARHPRLEAPPAQSRDSARSEEMRTLRSALLERAGVRHGFSTRGGGVSEAYGAPGELNLGFTASDPAENVSENRSRFLSDVFGQTRPLVTLRQIHSSLVHRVVFVEQSERKGDGLMTDEPGIALGIGTADCVPVLVADPKRGAVAAFHAGWRGTLRHIVEHGVGRMRMEFGSEPRDMVAAIGPAIGQCCYAVGDEVEGEFRSQFRYADELFREVYDEDPVKKKYPMLFMNARAPGHGDMGPGLHLDLQEANRRQLIDAGLRAESVDVLPYCTNCRTDLFFSYRAEQGFTGRMLAVITRD